MALPSLLLPGDPAPVFAARTAVNANFRFDTVAGRYIVLCFLGSSVYPAARRALAAAFARPDLFDDTRACFFAVTADPADEAEGRIADRIPGYRIFWDFDRRVASAYRIVPQGAPHEGWVVLDPTLRVLKVTPFRADGSDAAEVLDFLAAQPPVGAHPGFEVPVPIIVMANVFEPELCDRLVALYESHGGEESGFMREVNGRTLPMFDAGHKRRRDHVIEDTALIEELKARFVRRVLPEIAKVHQFAASRMERHIVACYDAEEGGHFRAHRDNTTRGTAHRRFAVSINLNDDFDGGEVSFPEYGPRSFKAPKGGAVVFSCSLLHSVSQVRRGRRYAYLPFLYDEAAARIREQNARFVGPAEGGAAGG